MGGHSSEPWSNAPVYLVLIKLLFSPVQAMGRYMEQIQESFRHAGFPEFKKGDQTTIFFPESEGQDPQIQRDDRWVFSNSGRTAQFVLTTSSLIFLTTDYRDHINLFTQGRVGLQVIQDTVRPASVHRVGLRYLDAIWPSQGTELRDYLNPGLVGIDLEGTLI